MHACILGPSVNLYCRVNIYQCMDVTGMFISCMHACMHKGSENSKRLHALRLMWYCTLRIIHIHAYTILLHIQRMLHTHVGNGEC